MGFIERIRNNYEEYKSQKEKYAKKPMWTEYLEEQRNLKARRIINRKIKIEDEREKLFKDPSTVPSSAAASSATVATTSVLFDQPSLYSSVRTMENDSVLKEQLSDWYSKYDCKTCSILATCVCSFFGFYLLRKAPQEISLYKPRTFKRYWVILCYGALTIGCWYGAVSSLVGNSLREYYYARSFQEMRELDKKQFINTKNSLKEFIDKIWNKQKKKEQADRS